MRTPVWYRTDADVEWRTGVTQCVSTTGAVIQSDDPPPVFDEIVIVIALSVRGCLTGRGRVVRAQPSAGPDVGATFAITVDHYTLAHLESMLNGSQPVLHRC